PCTYTLPLHDALPISQRLFVSFCSRGLSRETEAAILQHTRACQYERTAYGAQVQVGLVAAPIECHFIAAQRPDRRHARTHVAHADRKSTRLNSSHVKI